MGWAQIYQDLRSAVVTVYGDLTNAIQTVYANNPGVSTSVLLFIFFAIILRLYNTSPMDIIDHAVEGLKQIAGTRPTYKAIDLFLSFGTFVIVLMFTLTDPAQLIAAIVTGNDLPSAQSALKALFVASSILMFVIATLLSIKFCQSIEDKN